MTTPTFDPTQYAAPVENGAGWDKDLFARRLNQILRDPTFSTRPGLAQMLADGDVTDDDLAVVSGSVRMFDLDRQVRLARQSGQVVNLSPSDKAILSSSGVHYEDVDFSAAVKSQQESIKESLKTEPQEESSFWSLDDDDNWFESVFGAIGEGVYWGVLHPLAEVGQALSQAVTTPYRATAASPYAFGSGALKSDPTESLRATAEQYNDMEARGYSGSFVDTIQYYYKGEHVYGDTSDLREQYGDDAVEFGKRYLADPEKAMEDLGKKDTETIAEIMTAMQGPAGKDLLERGGKLDALHYSPGRDIARTLFEEGSWMFNRVSGVLDAAATWYADPLLVAGKIAVGLRTLPYRLDSAVDMNGVRRLMTENQAIRDGWQGFLDTNKAWREATDDTVKAKLYAGARVRYKDLMGLWDEVAGRRVIPGDVDVPHMAPTLTPTAGTEKVLSTAPEGQQLIDVAGTQWMTSKTGPIETLEEMTDYLVSTNGLMRLSAGLAAEKTVLMPGKVSLWAERKALHAERRTEKGLTSAAWLSYDDPAKIIPHESEANGFIERGMQFRNFATSGFKRNRFERVSRRLSSLLPDTKAFDFRSVTSAEQVRRVALMYLPKYEADRLASLYSAGNVATRRQVYKGVLEQVFHASGMTLSESGRMMYRKMSDQVDQDGMYAFSPDALARDAEGLETKVALYPEQLSNLGFIPDFTELQRISAKLAVWDRYATGAGIEEAATTQKGVQLAKRAITAPLNAEWTDKLLYRLKLGMIIKPASGLRNALDELSGAALRGEGGAVLRAQRVAAAARRVALDDHAAKRFTRLTAGVGRPVTKLVDAMTALNSSRVARAIQKIPGLTSKEKVGVTTAELEQYAAELPWDRLGEVFEGLTADGRYLNDTWSAKGVEQAQYLAKRGFAFQRYETKWGLIPLEDSKGLEAWSHNLQHRFGEGGLGQAALPGLEKGNRPMAVNAVLERLKSPELEDFRTRASILTHLEDGTKVTSDELMEKALLEHADRVVADLELALTGGKKKVIATELIDLLRAGTWDPKSLATIDKAYRPSHAIGREYAPIAAKSSGGQIVEAFTGAASKAYDLFVTRQVNWLSRNPLFTVFYAKARKNMGGYEKSLVDAGLTAERAEEMAMKVAQQHAAHQVAMRVDNPTVRSQFSTVARNFWMFERAQEDFLRRWGRMLKEDPTRLRKAQLALEGGQHAGFIDRDENGSLIFTYPGTGAVITGLTQLTNAMGITEFVKIPQYSDLSSKLIFLNASLDNPIGFSATPLIVTPFKFIKQFFPEESMFLSQVDRLISGQLGAGRNWFESFAPPVVQQAMVPFSTDERNSQFASAVVNSMKHMVAAGQMPAADATADEWDKWGVDLRVATRNQLFLRFAFGLFLPAAPSAAEADDTLLASDPMFKTLGIQELDQEYKYMLNKWGYETAYAVWQKTHPGELVYTTSRSTTPNGAFVAPTEKVGEFIDANYDWVNKYRTLAPYFLPQNPGGFSQAAWNAELDIGLRKYKSIDEFYREVRLVNGRSVYYDAKDYYDAKILEAQKVGDKDAKKSLEAQWAAAKEDILTSNPLLRVELADYAAKNAERGQSRADLQKMLADPDTPNLPILNSVKLLSESYDAYSSWIAQHKGMTDKDTKLARQAVQAGYVEYAESLIGANPDLTPIYNSLFRID